MPEPQLKPCPLAVVYVHENPGIHTGNILWEPAHPMRAGIFPQSHPCAGGSGRQCTSLTDFVFGTGDQLTRLRERGYWASCFPEGDGITMRCREGQSAEQAMRDIHECFGWTVTAGGR